MVSGSRREIMPRTCTVCRHEQRNAVEGALIQGVPLRDIAEQHALSTAALVRHRDMHLSAELLTQVSVVNDRRRASLLEQAELLLDTTNQLLRDAENAGQSRVALAAVREARGCLELLAKFRLVALATSEPEVEEVEVDPELEAARALFAELRRHYTVTLELASTLPDRIWANRLRDAMLAAVPDWALRNYEGKPPRVDVPERRQLTQPEPGPCSRPGQAPVEPANDSFIEGPEMEACGALVDDVAGHRLPESATMLPSYVPERYRTVHQDLLERMQERAHRSGILNELARERFATLTVRFVLGPRFGTAVDQNTDVEAEGGLADVWVDLLQVVANDMR
jgi:hypothetical protein